MDARLPPIEDVKRAIYASKLDTWTGDRDWTLAVKKSLGDLGVLHGWGVCTASLTAPFEREWLFDQTWYFSPLGQLQEIGLLMECEWSPDLKEIQYDFEKLLVARAPLKIMIFSAGDAGCDAVFDHLVSGFSRCKHADSDEHYLLVCWRGSSRRYEIREWPSKTPEPTAELSSAVTHL